MSKERKRYSPEFKLAAVNRMGEAETVAAVARELGVRRKFLYLWREQLEKGGRAALERPPGRPPGPQSKPAPKPSAAELRVVQLERLLGQKQAELDFFKRTFEYVGGAAANRTSDGVKGSIAVSKARSRSKGRS